MLKYGSTFPKYGTVFPKYENTFPKYGNTLSKYVLFSPGVWKYRARVDCTLRGSAAQRAATS
eukprot:5814255-Pleurochrysis_carterae.AAC.1